jgi:hypothetical protein
MLVVIMAFLSLVKFAGTISGEVSGVGATFDLHDLVIGGTTEEGAVEPESLRLLQAIQGASIQNESRRRIHHTPFRNY